MRMPRDMILRLVIPAIFTLVCAVFTICALGQLPSDDAGLPKEEGPWALPAIAASFGCGCIGPVWLAFGSYYWLIVRPTRVGPPTS
ncbi:MAG: hypothetical protein EXS10_09365, partial [Phycisphaerales bacterium]|nr:hypothetical protein [Phycisphaerales bacterium]